MKDMKGILIFLDNTVMFASQWDEKAIYRENLSPMRRQKEIPVEQAEDAAEEPEESGQMEKLQVESVQAQQSREQQTEELQPEAQRSGDMWMDLWEKLNGMYGAKNLFENMPEISGIHMELKDLRELPNEILVSRQQQFFAARFFQLPPSAPWESGK